jgi:hypothetical protein
VNQHMYMLGMYCTEMSFFTAMNLFNSMHFLLKILSYRIDLSSETYLCQQSNLFFPGHLNVWGHCGRDRLVVGFTTTCTVCAYRKYVCRFI